MQVLAEIALQSWFSDAVYELKDYFRHLSSTQWGVLCVASVAFGFLCLRGFTIRD